MFLLCFLEVDTVCVLWAFVCVFNVVMTCFDGLILYEWEGGGDCAGVQWGELGYRYEYNMMITYICYLLEDMAPSQ